MCTEAIRLTTVRWIQIAIGAIYLLTGALVPFLTDQPMLERLAWAAVLGLLPGFCVIAASVRMRQGRVQRACAAHRHTIR